MTDVMTEEVFEPNQAILDLPPKTQTVTREHLGADGRRCISTVFQQLSSPRYFRVEGHERDNYYAREVLAEEVIAWSQCDAKEVSPAEFAAIRAAEQRTTEGVKEAASAARSAVGAARAEAFTALAKSAGLTADQVEALFGRSVPVADVSKATSKKGK